MVKENIDYFIYHLNIHCINIPNFDMHAVFRVYSGRKQTKTINQKRRFCNIYRQFEG